jgi:hypothetical protein
LLLFSGSSALDRQGMFMRAMNYGLRGISWRGFVRISGLDEEILHLRNNIHTKSFTVFV